MGNLTLNGATSGQITLAPTTVAGTNTITLPAATGTVALTNTAVFNSATTLSLQTGGTTGLYIDASQNVGIGATPTSGSQLSTIQTTYGIFGGSSQININTNAYYNGGWKYIGTGYATLYSQNLAGASGTHTWSYSASGTAGNAITFNEAMRIDSSGNLLVGTTSYSAIVNGTSISPASGTAITCNAGFNLALNKSSSPAQTAFLTFNINSSLVGYVNYNGAGVTYNVTSDEKLKNNIQNSEAALPIIEAIKVRQFDWKSNNFHQRYGFIAQELNDVLPEVVTPANDTIDTWCVDYSKLTPLLVAAIQEQQATITALTARIAALEAK